MLYGKKKINYEIMMEHYTMSNVETDLKDLIHVPFELNAKCFILLPKELIAPFKMELEIIRDYVLHRISTLERTFLEKAIELLVNREIARKKEVHTRFDLYHCLDCETDHDGIHERCSKCNGQNFDIIKKNEGAKGNVK